MREAAGFSALINGPLSDAWDIKAMKPWFPKMADYINLQAASVDQWNKASIYRQ